MKKAIAVVLLISSVAVWRWESSRGSRAVTASDASLTADRIWLDHVPTSERDTINIFFMLGDRAMGVYQTTSMWAGKYEGFRYEADGTDVRMVFPQTQTREKVTAISTACTENHMDYCLVIDGGSHGVKKYYSRRGWEIERGRRDLKEQVDAIVHDLAMASEPEHR